MTSFYTQQELAQLGLKHYGENVLISRKASIYGAAHISIGDHVRVDDFCILSGRIEMGSYIHISAYSGLWGGEAGIFLKDFSAISSRCAVYAQSDDYSGAAMTNPMVPPACRHVIEAPVLIGRHVVVGSGCTILPGVCIGEGASVGSMSLVNRSLDGWSVYAGIPCRRLKERANTLLELEKKIQR